MDFFDIFFLSSDHPEKDIIIRFYLSIVKLYVEYYKDFDIFLYEFWKDKIKPFIYEKYPQSSTGIFTANSDIHYLIKLIDDLQIEYAPNINKTKDIIDEKPKNENLNPTPPPTLSEKDNIENHILDNIKQKQNNEKDSKNKLLFKRVSFKEEEDIKILRNKNLIRINNFLKDFIKENKLNLKRSNSMMSLRHSKTISSLNTCADSVCLEEQKYHKIPINLTKLRIDNNENILAKESKDFYQGISEKKIETKQTKKKFGNFIGIQDNQNVNLIIKMTPQYKEIEKDNENIYMEYNEKNELCNISVDLLLKKIIFEDFMQKNVLLIYHFCQQCFCFIKSEIFFKKLFHCYKTYKNKNISLDNLKNLIEFINILIIEMFEFYNKVNLEEMQISLIKKNYNELISDLILNFKEEEKKEKNNCIEVKEKENCDEKKNIKKTFRFDSYDSGEENYLSEDIIFDKNNLLNLNLNIHKKKINIFFYKEKEEENKEEKNNNEIKDLEENLSKDSDINIKFPSFFKISKTLKMSNNNNNAFKTFTNDKIDEEIKEENNEDDSNSSSSNNSIKHSNSINDNIYEDIQSDEEIIIEEEGFVDIKKSEQINMLYNKIFTDVKILSTKEQILYQLNNILPLLNMENSEEVYPLDIQKQNPLFNFIQILKQKLKLFLKK